MSSVEPAVFESAARAQAQSIRKAPYVAAYTAMIVGLFVFPVTLVAVLIAYVKRRGDASTTWCSSHCRWVIHTFWWQVLGYTLTAVIYIVYAAILGFIIGPVSLVANPGILLGFGVWAWSIYRIAKGATALSEERGV